MSVCWFYSSIVNIPWLNVGIWEMGWGRFSAGGVDEDDAMENTLAMICVP